MARVAVILACSALIASETNAFTPTLVSSSLRSAARGHSRETQREQSLLSSSVFKRGVAAGDEGIVPTVSGAAGAAAAERSAGNERSESRKQPQNRRARQGGSCVVVSRRRMVDQVLSAAAAGLVGGHVWNSGGSLNGSQPPSASAAEGLNLTNQPDSAKNAIPAKDVKGGEMPGWIEPEVTSRAYMTIAIDGKEAGTIKIKLYGKATPITVANFEALITGDNPAGVSYKGTTFYRVVKGLSMQAGAIGGGGKAKTGTSSTGEPFDPENYDIKHRAGGLLSMARGLDGKVDSRFFINLQRDAGWADDRYVAFGRVEDEEEADVLYRIDKMSVGGVANSPKSSVVITDCGMLPPLPPPSPQ